MRRLRWFLARLAVLIRWNTRERDFDAELQFHLSEEVGVRIPVGASPGSVEWMTRRGSLVLVTMGLAIGLPAGVFVARLVSSMLFQLSPGDPMTIVGTLATLTVASGPRRSCPLARPRAWIRLRW